MTRVKVMPPLAETLNRYMHRLVLQHVFVEDTEPLSNAL